MATWVGALARGGVFDDPDGEAAAGEAVAAFVVGEPALNALRRWFEQASFEVATRERRAAVEACVLMARADRRISPEERELLEDIAAESGLPDEHVEALRAMIAGDGPAPEVAGLEDRLTQPVLRELIVALAWELALADASIDPAETRFFDALAQRLGVSPARASELKDAVSSRVG